MSSISRRSFLKLGAAGLAALAGSRLITHIEAESNMSETNIYVENNPENASFLCFNIEAEITPDIITTLRSGFDIISKEATSQSNLKLTEDENVLGDFDEKIYRERSHNLIESFINLQSTYSHFKNNESSSEENDIAIKEIKKRFYKLALPLSLYYREFQNVDTPPSELFAKLYKQYLPINTPVPIDPLIGEEIYEQIGDEVWFWDFDMAIRPEDGQLLGTYPCTRKLFYQSGLWLDELAWESGGEAVSNYPTSRPERGMVNEVDYLLDGGKELVKIPVEKAVVDNMLLELEKLGLDRSFANLIIRNAGGNEFYGGVVYISRETLDRNGDINLFRNSDTLTGEFFENNKDGVMFTLVHEIFHVLSAKITLLHPIDRFKVISKIKKLNLSLNPVFKREELCGDSMNTNNATNIYEENGILINNLSETNRTKYLIQHLMGDVNNSIWPELSQIGIYSKYFDQVLVNFVNVRVPSDFDLSKRFASAKYSETYFSLAIQKYYENEYSTMTHLDKFVFEELISRVNTTGLYSESIIWYQNEDTSTYYSSTLPLLLIYTSMARGDNRFMAAIKEDLADSVKHGIITELESKYKFRKMLRLSKQIAERNQASETNISSPEEFLADQFSFAMNGNLKPDIYNFFSGLKSQRLIEDSKDVFVQLIEFYKDRNLAQLNTKSTV